MTSLKQQHATRQQLTTLCGDAVQQQIAKGTAQPSQLRQRRRHLLKALRKHLPNTSLHTPQKILHSALMVLALWGFGGLVLPNTAQANASFEHFMLEGFTPGNLNRPTLVDIDNDGDLDAFVGNGTGMVNFYQNNGTATTASFTPADGVSVINPLYGFDVGSNSAVIFADIDNDGDKDAFVGNTTGTVSFYQNTGTASSPAFTAADGVTIINPLAAFDVGSFATPAFADIDNDGDLDAFVGEASGTVKFFQNNGTASTANFVAADGVSVINPLGGFTVGGLAAPALVDIDNDGDLDAFVGVNNGTVMFYQNDGSITAASFVAADNVTVINPLYNLDMGGNSAPAFADIDSDGDLDVFVGPNSGPVRFFRNIGSSTSPNFDLNAYPLASTNVYNSAMPALVDIDNDGDLDAFVGQYMGPAGVQFYQNNGSTSSPDFVAADGVTVINPLAGFTSPYSAFPAFADIDNDGDLDAFIGNYYGTVSFFQNDGTTTSPSFVAADGITVINPLATLNVGGYAAPAFVDIDNDGDLDAFVGTASGTVRFYQNDGTAAAPNFVAADGVTVINPLVIATPTNRLTPAFIDIDHDGDLDVFLGNNAGTVLYYQNSGSTSVPSFVAADDVTVFNPLDGFDLGSRTTPAFADFDNDGDSDVVVGEAGGSVRFIDNHEIDPTPAPTPAPTTGSNGGGGGAFGFILLWGMLLTGLRRCLTARPPVRN